MNLVDQHFKSTLTTATANEKSLRPLPVANQDLGHEKKEMMNDTMDSKDQAAH